jgi:hypothetical protein
MVIHPQPFLLLYPGFSKNDKRQVHIENLNSCKLRQLFIKVKELSLSRGMLIT